MDKRGLTVDPDRSVLIPTKWWETIGGTQRPSPYIKKATRALQSYRIENVAAKYTFDVWDNSDDFSRPLYSIIWNGGLFSEYDLPKALLESGTYPIGGGDEPKHYFASVKIYDEEASWPGILSRIPVDYGDLAIDSDGIPVYVEEVVNPNTLVGYDNGSDFQNHMPGPVYDGGSTFAYWGVGEVIDGAQYRIIHTDPPRQEIITTYGEPVVFEAGQELDTDSVERSKIAHLLVEGAGFPRNDIPPGTMLGEINYELVGCVATITDWEHFNWPNADPVRQAFRAMVNSLPPAVTEIYVPNSPHAFWISLGFEPIGIGKGRNMLKYNPHNKPVTY